MKIVSFWRDQDVRFGFLVDDEVLDVALAASMLPRREEEAFFRNVVSFIRGGDAALAAAAQLIKKRPVQALPTRQR